MSIQGMICPLITPLTEGQQVDVKALKSLCETHVRAGTDVLFALGTTAEFYGLTLEQRKQVTDVIVQTIAGRIPVIVGISGDSTTAALVNYRVCKTAGVAGYVASTPYFLSYTQDELKDHFRTLANVIGGPIILYNYPGRYRHRIDIDTVAALTQEGLVSSIKDTAGDFEYLKQLLEVKKQFPKLGVFESALQNLAKAAPLGVDGSVQAIANLFPAECAAMWKAIQEKKFAEVQQRSAKLWDFHVAIEKVAIFIAALKGCMAARDWCTATTAAPTRPVSGDKAAQLSRMVKDFLKEAPGFQP